ncbi:aminotransferase class V-fold PLP-dependent enzyme [Micromonospora sp. NPDC050417]|uniref:aminotransferase class V-fold PLP-dependent enzyme n=1 Tax=Micromonospora sp. NPDC050417 TaxID=3364280 RepID=UPI003790753E
MDLLRGVQVDSGMAVGFVVPGHEVGHEPSCVGKGHEPVRKDRGGLQRPESRVGVRIVIEHFRPRAAYLSRLQGTPLDDLGFVALDFETTGLEAAQDRIVEIAACRFRADGTIVDEYASRIDPVTAHASATSRFHGLTDEDVQGAPRFALAWPEQRRLLSGAVVVAHNLRFEDEFLRRELQRLDVDHSGQLPGVCMMVTSWSRFRAFSYKQKLVFRTLVGTWPQDAHTALGDVRNLCAIFAALYRRMPDLRYVGPAPVSLGHRQERGLMLARPIVEAAIQWNGLPMAVTAGRPPLDSCDRPDIGPRQGAGKGSVTVTAPWSVRSGTPRRVEMRAPAVLRNEAGRRHPSSRLDKSRCEQPLNWADPHVTLISAGPATLTVLSNGCQPSVMQIEHPLEPNRGEMLHQGQLVLERLADFIDRLPQRPAADLTGIFGSTELKELVNEFLGPPPQHAGDLAQLLGRLDRAVDVALETAGPGYFAYIPGGGLYSSALAAFYTQVVNRYGSIAATAPVFTALEESVLGWIARDVCGLPAGSGGLLTTGGSMANLSAIVAARHDRLGENIADGTLYVTAYAHHSVAKAARIAGIASERIRVVPSTPDLRMDVASAAAMIAADRSAGLRPFLVVASAGTTDTGTIDPLPQIATLAADENLWFHVDAAYGGFFRLTERGRSRLAGMELADSVTLDPHKTLFLPFGTGALVVREPARLAAAHQGTAGYLQDQDMVSLELPDYAHLGLELSHEVRGLRVWLPLHLHGVDAFRAALDEKLDLTERVYEALRQVPNLEVLWRPDLSTVAFRVRAADAGAAAADAADAATRELLTRVNASQRAYLSSTVVDGRQTVRVTIVAHRSHAPHVDEVIALITEAASAVHPL